MTSFDQNNPRVIALAVDGMEPSLLNEWIETGDLPHLRELRESGTYGTAHCSSISSATQWTTHFTGVSPETHGVTGFLKGDRKRKAGDPAPSARELINLSDISLKTYPELLSESGVRVGLINPLPLWPPLELDDGFCISGILTPPSTDRWVYPPELAAELNELGYMIDVLYGDRPYGFVDDDLLDEVSLDTLYQDMFDVLDARIQFTKRAIEEDRADYVYALLKSIDIIQHCFWAHMENDEPTYGNAIFEAYQRVDDLVGWILEETDANLLVFSDHGFKPRQSNPPSKIHRVANSVNQILPIPTGIKQIYNSVMYDSVETNDDNISISQTTGVHANPATWALAGPDVGSTSELRIKFEDIPPTILALLDEAVPASYVGAAVEAVPTPDIQERTLEIRRDIHIHQDEAISERLHNLGYAEMVDE